MTNNLAASSGLSSAKPIIFGCAGPRLSAEERRFFAQANPAGFILFARNCESPEQISALAAELRASVDRADAPVLIDQEGGRVQRLRPPHWRNAPAAQLFGDLYEKDREAGLRAAKINARLMAAELAALGIDVDCTPCLDLAVEGASSVIGDRAFSTSPETIAALGRAVGEGMLEGGIIPVIKHIPGHGRALVDSHEKLPVVPAGRALLEETDFIPFKRLADMPWAMTAHIVYEALDAGRPATWSRPVIEEVIRQEIGFDGVLVSDDINMRALDGPLPARALKAIEAGCDLALHCSGDLDEMKAVAAELRGLTAEAADRLERGRAMLGQGGAVDSRALLTELEGLLA